MSGFSTSGGATRNAPRTHCPRFGFPSIALTRVEQPSEWATATTGFSAASIASATRAVQSSATGFAHSACSTRRAADSLLSHRVIQ